MEMHESIAALQRQIEDLQRGAPAVPGTSSQHETELQKWNTPRRLGGYKCDGFEEYPKGLYRLGRTETGTKRMDFTVARSGEHERGLLDEGWRADQHEAIARFGAFEEAVSQAAAEAAARARTMPRLAREEYERAEDEQSEHVTDVTGSKKKR
jgi:hypothetical protein